jgi:hypothetical protein
MRDLCPFLDYARPIKMHTFSDPTVLRNGTAQDNTNFKKLIKNWRKTK